MLGASAQESERFAGLLDLCLSSYRHVTPDTLWSAWSLAPQSVIPLLLLLALYLSGAFALAATLVTVPVRRAFCFAAGWIFLAIAFLSPLCRLSASLATAHMVQHVIIAGIAPPLLVLGAVGHVVAARLRPAWRTAVDRIWAALARVAGSFGGYVAITALYGMAIWMWHAPIVYDGVLQDSALHVAGYAGLTAVSILFWAATVSLGTSGAAGAGSAALALLITTIHTGFLGALLTLAPTPWFASATGGPAWGFTPLEDQQIAGLIMWVPMAGIYLAGTLWMLYRALDQLQKNPPLIVPPQ